VSWCFGHGVAENTVFRWKSEFGGMDDSEAPSAEKRAIRSDFAWVSAFFWSLLARAVDEGLATGRRRKTIGRAGEAGDKSGLQ
jgi:hypothetical protein